MCSHVLPVEVGEGLRAGQESTFFFSQLDTVVLHVRAATQFVLGMHVSENNNNNIVHFIESL